MTSTGSLTSTTASPDAALAVDIRAPRATTTSRDDDVSPAVLAFQALQLGTLAFLAYQFHVESAAFANLFALACCGFVVHAILPYKYRVPSFCVLCLMAIFLVLRQSAGAVLLLLALPLCAVFVLPLSTALRIAILITATVVLGLYRAFVLVSPALNTILPVLASMFIFRAPICLYDLHQQKKAGEKPSPWHVIAYFLLLPNVCFPLFPVVDFKTLIRSHYDRPASDIYQTGIRWILEGFVHLMIYRLIYRYFYIRTDDVVTAWDRVRFVFCDYLLYIKVSGQFHVCIGILHLFGFNLPRTHNRYYLARDFGDLWHRINIYWTSFMQKLFYLPLLFRLRRFGPRAAVGLAAAAVIVVSCLLHSVQTFWLTAIYRLKMQDVVFWAAIGGMLVWTNVRAQSAPSVRRAGSAESRNDLGHAVVDALKRLRTFVVVAVLWSLWSCDSLERWVRIVLGTGGQG